MSATLAQRLGLRELVDGHVILGDKPGGANVGDKLLTLVMSALADGDCIDDAVRPAGRRHGKGARLLGQGALDAGDVPAQLPLGHVPQLDRVSRELLARAFPAGARPGSAPFPIDLDSTICETYGLKKQGALHHRYTHVRGYHPLLAVAAGTGDVLMARLREAGRTPPVARPIPDRVDHQSPRRGAAGQLTVRADSGLLCPRRRRGRPQPQGPLSITIRQRPPSGG